MTSSSNTFTITEKPEILSSLQVETFTSLIKANPPNSFWQETIKDAKSSFPDQLGDVSPTSAENLGLDDYDLFTSENNYFTEVFATPPPLSNSTGTKVLVASEETKSFAVKAEVSLTNFLSAATKLDNAFFDLPGEIKRTASLIAAGAQGFVGSMSNTISDALVSGIRGGLSTLATTIFSAIPQYNIALRIVTTAQTALVNPVSLIFKGVNCLASKVVGALQGVVEDMLTAFVKNALNAPACAIQQFIGAVITKVNSMIDNIKKLLND